MKAYWNEKKRRWIASSGSRSSRVWTECKTPGERGRLICEARHAEKFKPEEPMPPGSLAEFIEVAWWPTVRHKAPGTVDRYKGICNNHLAVLQPMPLEAMRFELLQQFVNRLVDAKKADGKRANHPKSVHCIYGVLTSILGLAYRTRRLTDDSYRHVTLPKIPKRKVAVVSPENARRLLDYLKGDVEFEGPVWASVMLGLRRGEVLGLKRPDIELREDMAVVNVHWNRDEDGDREKLKNKDEGEPRLLFVPREWGEKLLGFCPDTSIYLFLDADGEPVDPPRLTKQTPKLTQKAGIGRVTFKTLRATCNTVLQASGVDTKMRMSMLGHATEGVQDNYLGENAATMVSAFKALEQAI